MEIGFEIGQRLYMTLSQLQTFLIALESSFLIVINN